MFDRIICVLVGIKVRGHLVMSFIQFMNLISVHFWTYCISILVSSLCSRMLQDLNSRNWLNLSMASSRSLEILKSHLSGKGKKDTCTYLNVSCKNVRDLELFIQCWVRCKFRVLVRSQ